MRKNILFVISSLLLVLTLVPVARAKSLSGTLTDLTKKRQNLKCTYSIKLDNQKKVKGVLYTANGQFRSEIRMPYLKNQQTLTYTLSDGQNLYMWNTATKMGTKLNIKKMSQLGNQKQNQEGQRIAREMKTKYNYNCSSWKAQNNFFQVPTNIQFTDLTAMMENLGKLGEKMQQGQNSPKNRCGLCAQLPESVRAQCLKSCQ